LGQVFNLVGETTAPAATIRFLQSYDIKGLENLSDAVEVLITGFVWPQVLPAFGEIVVVSAGLNTNLDIEAEQAELVGGFTL
jgi:hypothetical protein